MRFGSPILFCTAVLVLAGCGEREASTERRIEETLASSAEDAIVEDGSPKEEARKGATDKEAVVKASVLRAAAASEDTATAVPETMRRTPAELERIRDGIIEKYALDDLETSDLQLAHLLERYRAGERGLALDIGMFLAYGDFEGTGLGEALEFLEEAATQGAFGALSELGRYYLTASDSQERDPALARHYFEQAVASDDADGAFLLALGHRNGLWSDADEETGVVLLETAAALGHIAAANALYDKVMRTDGGSLADRLSRLDSEYPRMYEWLENGVAAGDVYSMNSLARWHSRKGEKEKARSLYEASAALGSFSALGNLMDLSVKQFRDRDYRESFKELLRQHIDQDNLWAGEANFRLALLESLERDVDIERVVQILSAAQDAEYSRSTLALKWIEDGMHPRKAIIAAKKLTAGAAYVRLLDERRADGEVIPTAKSAEKSPGSTPPVLLESEGTSYPNELRGEGASGSVLVQFVVLASGLVSQPLAVESSHAGFEQSALEMVQKMRFEPARKDGKPIAVKMRLRVSFKP